jgi:hypothetical protein
LLASYSTVNAIVGYSAFLREEVVDESAECQAIRPGRGEVLNLHILKQGGEARKSAVSTRDEYCAWKIRVSQPWEDDIS